MRTSRIAALSGMILACGCMAARAAYAESSAAADKGYWLRPCPSGGYGAFWHLELKLKSMTKETENILSLLTKEGARPTQAMENFPITKDGRYRQVSFSMERKKAGKVLEKLRKKGVLARSSQKESQDSEAAEHCGERLARLQADRSALGTKLEAAPAILGLLDATIESFRGALLSYEAAKDRVLLNIVIEEK
ncbi:MAG: hypothetical protein WCU88_11225 [Elusimicrobiota bacterium]|jgi:hypothetical protein